MGSSTTEDDAPDSGLCATPAGGVTKLGAERWHRLKELFVAALDQPPSQRDAFVTGSCTDDPELRARVLELLRAAEIEDGFIEQPASDRLD